MTKPAVLWNRRLAPYARPDARRSISQLAMTLLLFGTGLGAAHLLHGVHWLLGIPASLVAGLFLVKLFIIQHDCGHRSFLASDRACDWIGRGISLLTLTPYRFWQQNHNAHHATSGDLDRRGHGDIDTLTVAEYRALGRMGQWRYRVYRNPLVLFGLGPSWEFLLRYRLPLWIAGRQRRQMVTSIVTHDLALVAFFGGLALLFGLATVAAIWLPTVLTAATIGVWLFYVQHQFDTTSWERHENWDFVEAALHGCSLYRLPGWLHWATGNIGYHHVHHLSSRIPNYRLAQVFREVPELQQVRQIGIMESLRCVHLALWCEERRRLVSFRDAHALAA